MNEKIFRVLVISYYFPPMGLSRSQRPLKLVKYLKNNNWNATVITTVHKSKFALDQSLQNELDELKLNVIRVEAQSKKNLFSGLDKKELPRELLRKIKDVFIQTFFIPDNKKKWVKLALKRADELLQKENFDAIFLVCPPFSLLDNISEIKKKFKIPIIVDYRDLWFGSHFSFYLTPYHRYLNKKKEYLALKQIDRVTVSNRKIKEKLLQLYPFLTFEDVVIITNGFDHSIFESTKPVPKPSNKMVLLFAGIFQLYSTPKYLLRAFKEVSIERPDIAANIELQFVGFLRKENKKLIRKLKLQEFVKDFGFVPYRESISKIKSADILWLMVENGKNHDCIIPSKVYDYMATRKPIIGFLPEGAAKMTLVEYGNSFICDPYDIKGIKNILYQLYDLFIKNELPLADEESLIKYRNDYLSEILVKQFQANLRA